MATEVIKSDGSKKPFDAEKIKKSIGASAKDADLSDERVAEVVDQVGAKVLEFAESKETVSTAELKEKILSELDRVESSAAEAWRKYDRETKGL